MAHLLHIDSRLRGEYLSLRRVVLLALERMDNMRIKPLTLQVYSRLWALVTSRLLMLDEPGGQKLADAITNAHIKIAQLVGG